MAFSPPVLGYLVKKGLVKGGGGGDGYPGPPMATPLPSALYLSCDDDDDDNDDYCCLKVSFFLSGLKAF